jgi:hypothetical protein
MFDLPKSTAVNRVIPKNAFDEYSNSRQKRLFSEKIEKIRWLNKLSSKTINLSGSDVKEIQVIEIELRQKDPIHEVLKIIDKAIPYHILFVLKFDDLRLLSSSEKHIHPTNENLAVIDWTFNTEWFNVINNCYKFNLKQSLDFVFADMIYQISGKQQSSELSISELISKEQKIKQLTSRIEKLKSEIKKSRQFNKKVDLNLELLECETNLSLIYANAL